MIVFSLQVSVHGKKLIYTVCHLLLTLIVTYDKHPVSTFTVYIRGQENYYIYLII